MTTEIYHEYGNFINRDNYFFNSGIPLQASELKRYHKDNYPD